MLVLFSLLALLLAARLLTDWLVPRPEVDFSAFQRQVALLQVPDSLSDRISGPERSFDRSEKAAARLPEESRARNETAFPGAGLTAKNSVSLPNQVSPDKARLFPFDPNTAKRADLLQLGLRPRIADILLKYREAGGEFRAREDLKKIYGLKQAVYLKLLPYIRIREGRFSGGVPPDKTARAGRPRCTELEINSADSTALLPLPGIGPVLSARIVRYRERLGGFHSPEQLLEVYGMDTASFHSFKNCLRADSSGLRKINLNEAGYQELRRLPYWSAAEINVVLNYREQHGPFAEITALYNIRALEEQTIQKVMPYLSLE
ncbi:DNA uptake protein ComE-like DNA-binding protein [Anseongella ginsenosidimutans]|uniref:DNA uptake protein ComE-like DNA-binding protein n=2 Tax=Anseongella ginsenosidimutans TaxID=496056 RepID=A0A4R3KQ41_9SPHI|nr:DNA uptake protein ComE-like DNA-binding protein [Anseongella ginsenosidimutans]